MQTIRETVKEIQEWALFLKKIRQFLEARGMTEVATNHLVAAGAFESALDTLKVPFSGGTGELHTSPEIEMKCVLAGSPIPIYQICKCFRDDPSTPIHSREFTMLEFYRANCDYRMIQEDTRELFSSLAGKPLNFRVVSIEDIVHETTGISLAANHDAASLRREIEKRNLILLSKDDTWEDMFFKLMMEKVESALSPETPVLVHDYPARLCALAKLNLETGLAERFEIYWQGMELCNGCTELDSLEVLEQRFAEESKRRTTLGKTAHPLPERLIYAMRRLPPAAGVAVGLDRLFLALKKLSDEK